MLLSSFLTVRPHFVWKLLAFIGCWQTGLIIIFPNDPFNLFALFAIFFATLLLAFKGALIEKVSAVIILSSVIIAVNYMTYEMGRMLFFALDSGNSQLSYSVTYAIALTVRIPIWAAIYVFFRKRLAQACLLLTPRMWFVVDIVSLGSLVGIITVLNLIPDKCLWPSYPACLACLLTNLGCIYLISYIADSIRTKMEIDNLRYQEAYYHELQQNQQETRKLHHDMNNHFSVIRSLLKREDYGKATEYVNDLAKKLPSKNRIFCQNSVVNAVINAKYELARQNQIDCFFNIDLDHMPEVDSTSLCCIFANTLDNAIDAACALSDAGDRQISLKARFDSPYFSYEIVNTKENPIRQLDNKFISQKADRKEHGFGLENVKDVVARLGGTIDISYTEDTFTVVILIKLQA
ncbi:GHKL domain-containing protein [Anaerovorax odorimutans]|uniref:GHKL domain-containing protein n=1 Tax=Anaerovorax odorimutans TaxID=109327 RepID=A0ABT1RSN0_9FIRM|nr:sensor histidine kinase [Anaerovorax odorimutans]MCQ4638198.1 GHKL domain-containing protein [Anaerovorax odorimutans]